MSGLPGPMETPSDVISVQSQHHGHQQIHYEQEDADSVYSRGHSQGDPNQLYAQYSNDSLPGRRGSGAPLLENYGGQMDNYSGPIYSQQYHSGPMQPPPGVQYSNPAMGMDGADPNLPYGALHTGASGGSGTGEQAKLAVLHGMILNDLNSVRRKVTDYMETSRSHSANGSDSVDPMERARLAEQLAQIEQQQQMLGSVLNQKGIDTNAIPYGSMMGSRAGSIAGDIPDANSVISAGQREAAIQNAIQRLQAQQDQMVRLMNDEGMPADMAGSIAHDPYGSYMSKSITDQYGTQTGLPIHHEQVDMEEYEEEDEPDPYDERPYQRQTKINWPGLIVFLLFICGFFFYMYIRIRHTLGIGVYLPYGIIVLLAECIGALAVLLYAMCIIVKPLDDNLRRNIGKAPPKPRYKYHLRVIVPCYSESLAILQRTVMAAYNATLPSGCTRTVYLCDDGKDPKKQEWVDSLDADDVVYVSGRKRKPGEMNGKSCNINNCLKQIYPKTARQGTISMREIVVVFDADQVASQEFFTKTTHLLDSGSDVAMILSPQCFYNINPGADIFNNSNIHFWEYMQPGYDAMGFISCTGTNFLCRARALQECGWFPEDTVTEDFGLGIQLTKLGWKCRYVQEYLAIGEAPEEVRNTFQQRSRWCKGHFQILFSSKCPMFDSGLNLFHKVMSCASCWSYFVNALTTPLLFLVPIISIWFGIFPIALNFWAALGITVYGLSVQLVQNYHHTFRHLKVLWFANLGNTLLWTVYFKACFNTSIARIWKGTLTFKTTAKGRGGSGPSAIRDIWIHMLMFSISFITVILGLVGLREDINLPLVISIIWALYNCVPYYLIIHYAFFGRQKPLKIACVLGMSLQFILQLLGLILVWILLPRTYDYGRGLVLSIEFFETQRSGQLPPALDPSLRRIDWRDDSALKDESAEGASNDLLGGWYVTGFDGNIKYTVPIAYSLTLMCWAYNSFPKPFSEERVQGYMLNNIMWGTEYLLNAHVVSNNAAEPISQGVYEYVGDIAEERSTWQRPESIDYVREGKLVEYSTQLYADVAAAFASCHMALSSYKQDYANKLLNRAISAYTKAVDVMDDDRFQGNFDEIDVDSSFRSESFYDDLVWAAAWLNRAQQGSKDQYLTDINEYYPIAQQDRTPQDYLFDWNDLFMGANLVMLQEEVRANDNLDSDSSYLKVVDDFLKDWVCGRPEDIDYTPKGRAYNKNDKSLSATVNVGFLTLLRAQMEKKVRGRTSKYVGYRCWSLSQARWILGDNKKLGNPTSFVIGYGKKWPEKVYDRASTCPPLPEKCDLSNKGTDKSNEQVLNGALVFGPSDLSDTLVDRRSVEVNDTMVRLDYNAALPGMMAGILDLGGTWAECLQGYGARFAIHPICGIASGARA